MADGDSLILLDVIKVVFITCFIVTNNKSTRYHLLLLFYFLGNMFRTLICTSSGVCDYVVELPHWSFRS